MRYVVYWFLIVLGMAQASDRNQVVTVGSSSQPAVLRLELKREIKEYDARDLSENGRLLVLLNCRKRIITYTIPLDGSSGQRDGEGGDAGCLLTVFDLNQGKEVGTTGATSFPGCIQFATGSDGVVYKEPSSPGNELKLWNVLTGEKRVVFRETNAYFQNVTLLQHNVLVGVGLSKQSRTESLMAVDLKDGTARDFGVLDPRSEKQRPLLSPGLSSSPDGDRFAYMVGGERPGIYVWQANPFKLHTWIDVSPAISDTWPINFKVASRDELMLLSGYGQRRGESEARLLVFNVASGSFVRQLELSFRSSLASGRPQSSRLSIGSAMAVSHDGRMVAISVERDERQALIHVFDTLTGAELTQASHPPVKLRRSDPFQARISYLGFTPDDKYLISSTYDTRIWQIIRTE